MTTVIYIKERASVGVVIICLPLDKVKDATMLKFACGTQIEDYDLTNRGLGKIVPGKQGGDPEIKLQVAGREDYPLANWPGAVAVTVTDRLYCLDGDRWRFEPSANNSTARGFLEKRYCPDRYDLPA
jgi:hypothetical protein